jgi:tellurite resistance protein TerC
LLLGGVVVSLVKTRGQKVAAESEQPNPVSNATMAREKDEDPQLRV